MVFTVSVVEQRELVVPSSGRHRVVQVIHAILQPQSIKGLLDVVYLDIYTLGFSIYNRDDNSVDNEEMIADIGPSRVRALPLAAGINEGGHYFR